MLTGEAKIHHLKSENGLGTPQEDSLKSKRTISFIMTRRSKLTEKFCAWLPAASSLLWSFTEDAMPLAFDTV